MSTRSLRRHSRRSPVRSRAPQKGNNGNGNGNGPPDTVPGGSGGLGHGNGHGHANGNSPDIPPPSNDPPPPPPSGGSAPDPNAGGGSNGAGSPPSTGGNGSGSTDAGNTGANSGSTPPDNSNGGTASTTSTSSPETSSSSGDTPSKTSHSTPRSSSVPPVNAQTSGSTTGIPNVSAAVIMGGDSSAAITPTSPSSLIPSASSTGEVGSAAALSHRSNGGAIAGGVVGAILFFALAFGAWIVYKRRRKNRIAPSAQYLAKAPAYPFAQGFGATAYPSEKGKPHGGKYGGAGTGAAGNANFRSLNSDSSEMIFSDLKPQMEQYRDERPVPSSVPLSPLPQPEVLYSTRPPGTPPPAIPIPGSTPGTPTTPNGRRIPFGTGTFQFPPRVPPPQQLIPTQPL